MEVLHSFDGSVSPNNPSTSRSAGVKRSPGIDRPCCVKFGVIETPLFGPSRTDKIDL